MPFINTIEEHTHTHMHARERERLYIYIYKNREWVSILRELDYPNPQQTKSMKDRDVP